MQQGKIKASKGICQTHIHFLSEDKMKEICHNNRGGCGGSTSETISY